MITCFIVIRDCYSQMQHMSHYYTVIVRRAYCMDDEYAIERLLVKSVKIVEKKSSHRKNIAISMSRDFKQNHDFNLLTIIVSTLMN